MFRENVKKLTMADVMGEMIDTRAFAEPKAKPSATKRYRIRTGEYTGLMSRTWLRIDKNDRKSVSILVKLSDENEKFRGTTFTKVSWMLVTKADGSPDKQFKLFSQLVSVLGAPESAKLDQVLGAIEGEQVTVWGQEYFNVPLEHVSSDAAAYAKKAGYATTRVYIKEGEDATAEKFLDLGYKSEFDVSRISELGS